MEKILKPLSLILLFALVIVSSACSKETTLSSNDTNDFINELPNIDSKKLPSQSSSEVCKVLNDNSRNIETNVGSTIDRISMSEITLLKANGTTCKINFDSETKVEANISFFNTKDEKITDSTFEGFSNNLDPKSDGRINSRKTNAQNNVSAYRIRKFDTSIIVIEFTSTDTSPENRNAVAEYFLTLYT